MFNGIVNLWGVLGATIVSFIIGFLWYGPLFGKMWMKLSKIPAGDIAKAKKRGIAKPAILNFIGTFVMAYVFANLISLLGVSTVAQGAVLGFWIWLGFFAATTLLGGVLWENKPWSLFVLNGLYWLITLKVMGALLVVWS